MRRDTLGGPLDALAVAFEHGPLAAALATGLVGFLKYRTSDISISVITPDGREVKGTAVRVRGRSAADLERALADAVREAGGADPPPGPPGDG